MNPLQVFANKVTAARRKFESNPGITTEWMASNETQQERDNHQ